MAGVLRQEVGRISMRIHVYEDRPAIGRAAALRAGEVLREAIARRGRSRLIAATGSSQLEFLDALCAQPDLDWQRVELFHLDEYLDLPPTHPASFCRFLQDRLIARTGIRTAYLMDGTADPQATIAYVGKALEAGPVDLACVGVGENGHLAFNEPPADLETDAAFLVVALDETSRRQQVGEGWFPRLEDVPTHAITMTVRRILQAAEILCLAPDARKARAVRDCFARPVVTPDSPASALNGHANTTVYLDRAAVALLPMDRVSFSALLPAEESRHVER